MKKFFLILFILPLLAVAQTGTPATHKVMPKESYSSIGRLYNINGRALAEYNQLDYDKGLSIGQVIKIPGDKQAHSQPPSTVTQRTSVNDPSGTPVYHTVQKKETLYSISKQHGDIEIEDIKKWNKLTDNAVSEGAVLIIGYKASNGSSPIVNKPVAKEVTKTVKPTPPEVVPVQKPQVPPEQSTSPATVNSGPSFFASLYTGAEGSEVKGVAGAFKSTSGWDDRKYYCLHNQAKAGSIIKITNTANNKFVYAKVLDVMPDLKQNNDVLVRLSNAAADALGASISNFDCIINY